MKKIMLLLLLLLAVFSCKEKTNVERVPAVIKDTTRIHKVSVISDKITKSEDKIDFIHRFYDAYLGELGQISPTDIDIEKVLNRYLTLKFKDSLSEIQGDFDPFLKKQDIVEGFKETFKVTKDSTTLNGYVIAYIDSYNKEQLL